MTSVCPVYGKFLAKHFDDVNVIGNIDFSILNVICNAHSSYTFPFLIFDNCTEVPL